MTLYVQTSGVTGYWKFRGETASCSEYATLLLKISLDTRPQSAPTLLGCKCFVFGASFADTKQYPWTMAIDRDFSVTKMLLSSGPRPVLFLAEEVPIPLARMQNYSLGNQ